MTNQNEQLKDRTKNQRTKTKETKRNLVRGIWELGSLGVLGIWE